MLLAVISAALGATSLAYEAFGNGRVAAIGVLITFALLVLFGKLPRRHRPRRHPPPVVRCSSTRGALFEVLVDGALIGASFLAAYFLRFDGWARSTSGTTS